MTQLLYELDLSTRKIRLVVDQVDVPEKGSSKSFPGLYPLDLLSSPWLGESDICLISSRWGTRKTILAVDMKSGAVEDMTPLPACSSWTLLSVRGSFIIAMLTATNMPPKLVMSHVIMVMVMVMIVAYLGLRFFLCVDDRQGLTSQSRDIKCTEGELDGLC